VLFNYLLGSQDTLQTSSENVDDQTDHKSLLDNSSHLTIMVSKNVIGGIVVAVAGGAVGHKIGYDAGFRAGYNQARWEMEQQVNAMRAEFSDQVQQLQAQVNQLSRVGASHDERMARIEQLLERLLTTLQAEAQGGR
jgi:hypothetical protein